MKIYSSIKNSEKIFLLFGGFASHFSHFEEYFKEQSFVLVYDYRDLDFKQISLELDSALKNQNEVILLAFSMGVWVANKFLIFNKNLSFKIIKNIAINGTLYGINDKFGISYKIFSFTARNFHLESFKKALFGLSFKKAKNFQFAEENQLKNELEKLLENFSLECEIYAFWDYVFISHNDLVFSTKTQIYFWEIYQKQIAKNQNFQISFVDSPHFAFFDREFLWKAL
ncbi:pimeloyl-ACP methyl esterase BioG family protein [Helicobacter burdigaliensis]|uniref:pimeloyl-ACP methyl esterase BioG family protein n=1 Tax=Helicobacter burdigaliensis TaxID=2315334 RepID=UPI000EF6A663|nr:pimeloyl-ACP methyl esterase BioG family protein [Helicobacter burdigaliensis]